MLFAHSCLSLCWRDFILREFYSIIYHFLPVQFFSIVLIIFIIEVAGAVVLIVFQGLVGVLKKKKKKKKISFTQQQWTELTNKYPWLSSCSPSQADQLLQGVEEGIRKDLTSKYGSDDRVTSLWDSTMEKVVSFKWYFTEISVVTHNHFNQRKQWLFEHPLSCRVSS